MSGKRARLVTALGALTLVYTLGVALLPRHSFALHAWSDSGWLLMTGWGAVESWRARGAERTQRLAYVTLAMANLVWMLAMIVWMYHELVLGRPSPFPTTADAGFIGYAPLYVVGIYLLSGGASSVSLSLRHVADLGIAVGTMLFCGVVIYYRPSVELGLPPAHVAVALGYPVAFLSATAFGLLAMLQRPAHVRAKVLALHLAALAVLTVAYSLYGVEILTRRYETGHALDPFWFAGLALSIWAVREDEWLPLEKAESQEAHDARTTLDALLPAIACAPPTLVMVTYRDDVRHVPVPLLLVACVVFLGSLALRGLSVRSLERGLRRKIRAREGES